MKTKQEIALDYVQEMNPKDTSKDKWFSEEEILEFINNNQIYKEFIEVEDLKQFIKGVDE